LIAKRYSVTALMRDVMRQAANSWAGRDATVPCNGCTACCRSGYHIRVQGPERDNPRLKHDGEHLLRNGQVCVHLVEDRCEVYDIRPRDCRRFDCRAMSLTHVAPGDNDGKDLSFMREAIAAHLPLLKTHEDRVLAIALQNASKVAQQRYPTAEEAAGFAIGIHREFLTEAYSLWQEYMELPRDERAEREAGCHE
jgi:hypothetical protein